jgi:hypothetical protein
LYFRSHWRAGAGEGVLKSGDAPDLDLIKQVKQMAGLRRLGSIMADVACEKTGEPELCLVVFRLQK